MVHSFRLDNKIGSIYGFQCRHVFSIGLASVFIFVQNDIITPHFNVDLGPPLTHSPPRPQRDIALKSLGPSDSYHATGYGRSRQICRLLLEAASTCLNYWRLLAHFATVRHQMSDELHNFF